MQEPEIQVGLLTSKAISFHLHGIYHVIAPKGEQSGVKEKIVSGWQEVNYTEGAFSWNDETFHELLFFPTDSPEKNLFELKDVMIGKNFHWQQHEDQSFQGALRFIIEDEQVTAINLINTERYLVSVISSEMSADASLELLKAHAVISRSWLLAQLVSKNKENNEDCVHTGDGETIRWYNRSAHRYYDVCADDHCQRYQGVTRATTPAVKQAVEETEGEILIYNGEICDARFSKCCGGVSEEFATGWEDRRLPYLKATPDNSQEGPAPDLTKETEAEKWIMDEPDAFCHTNDQKILSQVLVNYDRETIDFYRWKVSYTQQELQDIIRERTGMDFGDIIDLVPLARGTSGRIYRFKIIGSKLTWIIGKELEIRKSLSHSHLFSSAFVVEKEGEGEVPDRFILHGAGWGHGVGLCQIGAAMMGERGYNYKEILLHYYKGAKVDRMY